MAQVFKKVYCAFCRLERNVCSKKHMGWTNVVLAGFASAVVMMLIWGGFDPRVIIIFATAIIAAEVFIHLRWRLTLPCPHCAFDPLLYKQNQSEASKRVKAKLDALKADPRSLLKANNPFQYLPSVVADERIKSESESRGLLSKRI